MSFYQDDEWVFQEFSSDENFILDREDHLPSGDYNTPSDLSEDCYFKSSITDAQLERSSLSIETCSLTDYPDLQSIRSEPLMFVKDVKDRRNYFSWSIAMKFEDQAKYLQFENRLRLSCNKAILVFNSTLREILGYLKFDVSQSKEGFHSFYPGIKFQPARGGCNDNAQLFLTYLKETPGSATLFCHGFNEDICNELCKYKCV